MARAAETLRAGRYRRRGRGRRRVRRKILCPRRALGRFLPRRRGGMLTCGPSRTQDEGHVSTWTKQQQPLHTHKIRLLLPCQQFNKEDSACYRVNNSRKRDWNCAARQSQQHGQWYDELVLNSSAKLDKKRDTRGGTSNEVSTIPTNRFRQLTGDIVTQTFGTPSRLAPHSQDIHI